MFGSKQNAELEKFADLVSKGTTELFLEREVTFTALPKKSKHEIIEYQGKMRADGMEKFDNESTYVSAVNFFANPKDMEKKKTIGTLIVYVKQTYLPKLLKLLQYPPIDDESEKAMLDSCGTLCNIISGRFKSEVFSAGYIGFEMSAFITYKNNAVAGVPFCFSEYEMYQVDFFIENLKQLVIEISIGQVPKRQAQP